MRVQIAKHLKSRSQTIRSAVNTYNRAASELRPPREPIKYAEVVNMAFLAQFDLLRHARPGQDVRNEPWAEPATRVLMDKYFELLRAKEEQIRLQVEWSRLRAWLIDEKRIYREAIVGLENIGKPLESKMVNLRWIEVERAHRVLWYWLLQTQKLPNFPSILSRHAVNPEKVNPVLVDALGGARSSGTDPVELDNDGNCSGEYFESERINGQMIGLVDDTEKLSSMVDTLGEMSI
jgi:hypothetical protein